MFINYIKIQLIRYFKGSSEIPILLAALICVIFALTCGSLGYYGLFQSNAMIEDGKTIGQIVTTNLSVGFLTEFIIVSFGAYIASPYLIGIFTCIYICSFYRHRSYVNLDISMRNRTLYCISELIICIICGLILYLALFVAVILCSIIDPISDGPNYLDMSVAFIPGFAIIIDKAVAAMFCAKLCRRSFSSIMVFVISDIVFNIASGLVAEFTKIEFVKYLLASPLQLMEASVLIADEGGTDANDFIITAVMMGVRCILLFVASVLLFKRKYEEKKQ